MQIKEQSLKDALNAACLQDLPKQCRSDNDDDGFWLKAVVLVKKRDFTQSYCLAKRKADGKILYKRDFGTISPIIGLISIHPYIYLDTQMLPYDTIDGKRDALAQYIGGDEEAKTAVQNMSDEEVELAMREVAIAAQNDADVLTEANKAVSELVHNPEPEEEENEDDADGEHAEDDSEESGTATGVAGTEEMPTAKKRREGGNRAQRKQAEQKQQHEKESNRHGKLRKKENSKQQGWLCHKAHIG